VVTLSITALRAFLDSSLGRPESLETEETKACLFMDLGETDDFFIGGASFSGVD